MKSVFFATALFMLSGAAKAETGYGTLALDNPAAMSQASSVRQSFWRRHMLVNLDIGIGYGSSNIEIVPISAALGYRFIPRVYAFFLCDANIGLLKMEDAKTFTKTTNLGGGIGYTVYREATPRGFDIDLRLSVAASVGHTEWKQTTYDVGISLKERLGVDFTVGYKHIQSRTAGIKNFDGILFKIGYCF